MVRFSGSKVRYGGTVHNDRDTTMTGFRPADLIQWLNSDLGRIQCSIWAVGVCPVMDVIPTVQPERGDSQKSNP